MRHVKPKKHLGQHFLTQTEIAQRIVNGLSKSDAALVEIGPGTGVLTQFLIERDDFYAMDVDQESIAYLMEAYPDHTVRIRHDDFLKADLRFIEKNKFDIIGNFPYNISSQIFFRILDHQNRIGQVVCMIQKEVAERIACPPGSKTYGILSVMLQAYYHIEYLFTVHENAFNPPPKVKSGVIKLTRNERKDLGCDATLFKRVVKGSFNQRRKTLRNSLKSLMGEKVDELGPDILKQRPEQLGVDDFVHLTREIESIIN